MDLSPLQAIATCPAPSPASEGQIRPSEDAELLAAIVQSSHDAILTEDIDGIVTSWNAGATNMFDYTRDEIVGRPASLLHDPEDEEELVRILNLIRQGKAVSNLETTRRRMDGLRIQVSISLSPLHDGQGRVIGSAKIIRDITDLKKAETLLRRAEKLSVANRLAASIAHEINNPLEALTNLIYLAGTETISDRAAQFLATAHRELARISHITTQALGFFQENAPAAEHDLCTIVDGALAIHAHRTSNIRINKTYASGVRLLCHAGELRQVFVNLIGNALDALASGGTLDLRIRHASSSKSSEPGIRFTIADTGSGMSPDVLQHLFEPFFSTKGVTNTGLGLWMCEQIVIRHRGYMRVKSSQRPGAHGTVVSVFLPVAH